MPAGALPPQEGVPVSPGPAPPESDPERAGTGPTQPDRTGAGSSGSGRSPGSVRRELAGYTALRLGLIAVLSGAAHLTGLLWLPSIALGVVAAALLSLLLLRRPMRRLAAAMAGRPVAAGRPGTPGGARARVPRSAAAATDDPYDDDPYDDDPYADDSHEDDPGGRDVVPRVGPDAGRDAGRDAHDPGSPGQDARTRASPTSSP